jgi:hypothetical protein
MKKKILLITFLSAALASYSQEDTYTIAMLGTLEEMNNPAGIEQLMECANRFERIARAEETRWLPYYYASYSLVLVSFEEQNGTEKDVLLDRAQQLLDIAFSLAPDESELHVLQAFLYPSRILVDPVTRGVQYIDRCFSAIEKAKSLDPGNPRAWFLEGMNKLNLPPSMGGGADVARPILMEAREKFRTFHRDDPLWPDWGEEANLAELEKL